jgi:hypothetical protein
LELPATGAQSTFANKRLADKNERRSEVECMMDPIEKGMEEEKE